MESIKTNILLVLLNNAMKINDELAISPHTVFFILCDIQQIPSIIHTPIEFVVIRTNVKMEIFSIIT